MTIDPPLHPFLVHLPLGLVAVLPVLSAWGLIARRRSDTPGTIWVVVVALHAFLAVSAWFAAEIGERHVHIVKHLVDGTFLDAHADAGNALQVVASVAFLLCLVGLARDRVGSIGRVMSTLLACAMLFMGYEAGRTGGELVYRHGAARAYVDPDTTGAPSAAPVPEGRSDRGRNGGR